MGHHRAASPVGRGAGGTGELAKRALDLSVAALLLLALLPLLGLLALLVRLSSPGPVFYRQQRVGRGGRPFWFYKFRTMTVDGDGPAVTAGSDRRITPIGRRLRYYKLDELPQLWNVVRGDMSLVGPRPEVPRYVRHYTEAQRQVLAARPGITGPSQLRFRHEETLLAGQPDVERFYLEQVLPAKLELDLHYLRTRSFWGDLRLLLGTAAILFVKSDRAPHYPDQDRHPSPP